MALLWSIYNICHIIIEFHFRFGCRAIYPRETCYDWWRIIIVSNLIGDHIVLWSEPRNSIACHQTLVQGLGKRLDIFIHNCSVCKFSHRVESVAIMRACLTWPDPNFEQEHYHLQYINALRVLWVFTQVFRSQQVVVTVVYSAYCLQLYIVLTAYSCI